MTEKIRKVLQGEEDNYLLPFFWQHGEDEATLRDYMHVIHDAGIRAVCLESRPHPDFAGDGWWHDLDIILDEAERLGMKVWILDDSHFPTGYANGAVDRLGEEYCRQSITHRAYAMKAGETLELPAGEVLSVPHPPLNTVQQYLKEQNPRHFDDDRILAVYFAGEDGETTPIPEGAKLEGLPLPQQTSGAADEQTQDGHGGTASPAEAAQGSSALQFTANRDGKLIILYLSRNLGYHTHYINMTEAKSVRVLIDTVYEPHWQHYQDRFGKTIAGFFSDEPELGNGLMYDLVNYVGNPDIDLPWSREIEEGLRSALGENFAAKLYLLWEGAGSDEAARVRVAYMDVVTGLVKKNFSLQIGDWCRAHGVQYIGHLIEDNDQHEMTGASLGHYFRGLWGQDWAGIDDIGGQVYPQGENDSYFNGVFQTRDGEFYHFGLGRLASSAAAIEPRKHGDSMCEIFGAYGWKEGVQLEKYLADHFLVRGINHFVPHAFSPKAFPDPDCPPHFYAHGHNPQYRAFGALCRYINRAAELLHGGRHVSPVAVLYSAEAVWADKETAMESHAVSRPLTEHQIGFDFLPQDVFLTPEAYHAHIGQEYAHIGQEYMHTGQEQERIGQEYIGQGHERIGQEQERIGQEQNAQLMAKTARGSVSGGRAGDERSGDSADLACGGLVVNTQRYAFVVVPGTRYIRAAFARAVPALRRAGTRVLFIDRYPEVLLGEHGETIRLNGAAMNRDSAEQVTPDAEILRAMREASEVLPLSELIPALRNEGLREVRIAPESPWIRIYHYEEQDGSAVLMFVNEGTDVYRGSVDIRACFAGAWEGRKVDDGAGEQRRGMSAGGNADDGGVKENGGNAAVFWYDAWENETHPAEAVGSCVELTIEPRKSRFLILDRAAASSETEEAAARGTCGHYAVIGAASYETEEAAESTAVGTEMTPGAEQTTGQKKDGAAGAKGKPCPGAEEMAGWMTESFADKRKGAREKAFLHPQWRRRLAVSTAYPDFGPEDGAVEVSLPDHLEEEKKTWSGIARYENAFEAEAGKRYLLTISDAGEAVEVFVNGKSLGYQIVPEYQFDLTEAVKPGQNAVRIEVATTLEREMSTTPDRMDVLMGKDTTPHCASGLNGTVKLYEK